MLFSISFQPFWLSHEVHCTRQFQLSNLSEILKRYYSNESFGVVFSCGDFNMLYKVVLFLYLWMKFYYSMTIQMKATKQFFPVVLSMMPSMCL